MFSIGNDELDALPEIDMCEKIPCHICGEPLIPKPSEINGEPTDSLIYTECASCDIVRLVGMNGKKLNWEGE